MAYDDHVDCDRQLNEAEDRILMLNKVIGDLNGRIKELYAGAVQLNADCNKAQLEASGRIKELEAKYNRLDSFNVNTVLRIKEIEALRDMVSINCHPPEACNDPKVLKIYMKACFEKASKLY